MAKTMNPEDEATLAALSERMLLAIRFIEDAQEFPSGAQLRGIIEWAMKRRDLRTLRLIGVAHFGGHFPAWYSRRGCEPLAGETAVKRYETAIRSPDSCRTSTEIKPSNGLSLTAGLKRLVGARVIQFCFGENEC